MGGEAAGDDPRGLETFFQLLRDGDVEGVEAELDRRPELVDAFDPDPWCCRGTPLNVAVARGDRPVVELLLERGADPDRRSDWWAGGFGALHSVKADDPSGLLPLLMDHGARVDEHAAAQHGLVDELTAILDRWPMRVNAPGGDGARPLHVAASPAVARLLLQRGAWLEARDVDHVSTPAQWAAGPRPDVARFLLAEGAGADPLLWAAVDDADRLGAALADDPASVLGCRLTAAAFPTPGSRAGHIYVYTLGGEGVTPLHVAARSGALEALELLLEAGADPEDREGSDGAPPLHLAACANQAGAVRRLLAAGADPNRPSGPPHRTSPLVWARACGAPEAERILREAGARAVRA